MMRKSVLVTAALFSSVAFAQQRTQQPQAPTDADTQITAEQLQTILKNGPVGKDGKPGGLSTQLFGRVGSCAFIRIVEADTPHAHGGVSEILVIQSGSATFETGGEMVGPFTGNSAVHTAIFTNADGSARAPGTGAAAPVANTAGGQRAAGARAGGGGGAASVGGPHNGSGASIAGGRLQQVKAGDVIMIPAGVPHHWTKVDSPIVYLDIKFPEVKAGAAAAAGGG
jgi:mannose-6-phosphate isomerase-like protein (cupin superfamily)